MRRARGFTLVEILVALILFAVVGGSLLMLFQSGLRGARLADAQSHAILLARSKLTELQAASLGLRPGTLGGELDGGYRWEAVLSEPAEPLPESRTGLAPLSLALTIHWGDPGDERAFTLDSLVLTRPEGS